MTKEELETIHATEQHINEVRKLLRFFSMKLLMRGETHDRSKLSGAELEAFVEYTPKLKGSTYGSEEYNGFLKGMRVALDNHYACNRHHPEHFADGVRGMNLVDLVEMYCDWAAATLRHDDGNLMRSIDVGEKRFMMDPQLAQVFRNTALDASDDRMGDNTARPEDERRCRSTAVAASDEDVARARESLLAAVRELPLNSTSLSWDDIIAHTQRVLAGMQECRAAGVSPDVLQEPS